jgi:putative hydrolase of the HAD superfamily
MTNLFVFDAGGVLVKDFDVTNQAARLLGLPESEFRTLAAVDMEGYMSGRMGSDEYWKRFARRTGIRVAENYWDTLFHPTLDPDVEELILELKSFGRVVCGTNTVDVHYDALVAGGHYSAFDAVYASHLMGVSKPDPDFWRRILEAEGSEADRAFFTDDMEENVRVARDLGFRTHWFTDAASLKAALSRMGVPLSAGTKA